MDLSKYEESVLKALCTADSRGGSVTTISRATRITQNAVRNILHKLVDAGYGTAFEYDGRCKYYKATEEGTKKIEKEMIINELLNLMMSGNLSVKQLKISLYVLKINKERLKLFEPLTKK